MRNSLFNACGYYVFSLVTTMLRNVGLYTQQLLVHIRGGYKSRDFTQSYHQLVRAVVHNFLTIMTEVTWVVIPTIHTTNKNNKKFYTNNLLIIYREAV